MNYNKDIADRLLELAELGVMAAETRKAIRALANELYPSRPAPGTVVWFREPHAITGWLLGRVSILGDIQRFGSTRDISFDDVEYVPADIITPGEVALDRTAGVKLNEHITRGSWRLQDEE